MTILTCQGCMFLSQAPEDGEVSCYEAGYCQDSLRCKRYFNPLTSYKVVQSVMQDIEFMEIGD